MKYRHEWKHEINYSDMLILRSRLSAVMNTDKHSIGSSYGIRSLYFDTPEDKVLMEKINGINKREKFRIRYYNDDTSYISLEKKCKVNELCLKSGCLITEAEARCIVSGDIDWMLDSNRPLCQEMYSKIKYQGLMPKTIVDYTREAFIYSPGNVRVTIDYNIRTSMFRTDFLNMNILTLPAGDSPIILEVKWDEFLPDIVKSIVTIEGRRVSAFSKYAQCRIYG